MPIGIRAMDGCCRETQFPLTQPSPPNKFWGEGFKLHITRLTDPTRIGSTCPMHRRANTTTTTTTTTTPVVRSAVHV